MNWKFWRKTPEPKPEWTPTNPPAFLEDKRTYVAHGEKVWGNSITLIVKGEETKPNEYSVVGWLSRAPFPRTGDELLLQGKLGWGCYVFVQVVESHNVHDQFFATVFGPYDLSDLKPQTKDPDEFIPEGAKSMFFRV